MPGLRSCSVAALLAGVVALPASSLQGRFVPLGHVPGGALPSYAAGISADGRVVVGQCVSNFGQEAFRWTEALGMVALGDLPGGKFASRATATNGDGSVVVGFGTIDPLYFGGPDQQRAFQWESGVGLVELTLQPGNSALYGAQDISDVGGVVVGTGVVHPSQPMYWTEATGSHGLGALPGGALGGGASAVSANGRVVVGAAYSPTGQVEAFRWTAHSGMQGLGKPPGLFDASWARGTNADGSVVVGARRDFFGREATRWTPATGSQGLGFLDPQYADSVAFACDGRGELVVGVGYTLHSTTWRQTAFVWTAGEGLRPLSELLEEQGIGGAEGWQFSSAVGVSADGRSIVGTGVNRAGLHEAFLVVW